jgi:hypothetical protein
MSAPKLYTPQDMAELFNVNRETVLRKCREGKVATPQAHCADDHLHGRGSRRLA